MYRPLDLMIMLRIFVHHFLMSRHNCPNSSLRLIMLEEVASKPRLYRTDRYRLLSHTQERSRKWPFGEQGLIEME